MQPKAALCWAARPSQQHPQLFRRALRQRMRSMPLRNSAASRQTVCSLHSPQSPRQQGDMPDAAAAVLWSANQQLRCAGRSCIMSLAPACYPGLRQTLVNDRLLLQARLQVLRLSVDGGLLLEVRLQGVQVLIVQVVVVVVVKQFTVFDRHLVCRGAAAPAGRPCAATTSGSATAADPNNSSVLS